jgi:hypothetical protein
VELAPTIAWNGCPRCVEYAVSLGIDHDTAQFAVNAMRLWLAKLGHERYPATPKVMVTADCGGSNGPRLRLWKVELQRLADETGLVFQVCHYPPGTSSRVEDRRGDCSLPVGCRRRFRPPPQSGLTWLRFLSPLVKPDVQISRIRLSPASSSLRARQVGAMERQGV